ncbi:hypothetical protein L873DRAFT_148838 [Choiromyces venosus 120613-1]|uniref:Uncharacterized protein n=1 Tax=Choiromyces venosus 120613-1 TaxID=1336337 RepID=A0A3N4JFT9_9PEZI|nr:hypothetical protein L873DRAFT_148838 [Choiromyces venosus 120613-1]
MIMQYPKVCGLISQQYTTGMILDHQRISGILSLLSLLHCSIYLYIHSMFLSVEYNLK